MIKCVRVFRRVVRVDCNFIEKGSCDPFSKISLHTLTLHIITIRAKSSKPSSSSRRRRFQKWRNEVDRDQAHTRTSSWNFTFRTGASSSDGRATGVKHQEPECMWSPYTSGRFINSCYDKASLTIKPYDRKMYVWNSIELVCIKVGAYCVINLILFFWSTFDVCV